MLLTEKQKELIEKLGVFHEKAGIPPTEARVAALLMISDVTELTFDEIRETLQVSKSATSNAINTLLLTKRIDYITKPGDRKRYFRSNLINWKKNAKQTFDAILSISNIMKEILEVRNPDTIKFNNDLAEVIDFTDFLHEELSKIFLKWRHKN